MEKGTYDTSEPATSTSGYRTEYADRLERNTRLEGTGIFLPTGENSGREFQIMRLVPGRSPTVGANQSHVGDQHQNGTGNSGQLSMKTSNSYQVIFKEDCFSRKQ